METVLTRDALLILFEKVKQVILARKADIGDLDAACGDGDLGVTMELGFRAVAEGLTALQGEDIGTLLMKSGMNFNRAASSTFGTIMATALMRAGKVVTGRDDLEPIHMIDMLRAAEDGIRQRGKAQPGDKTVLDALIPLNETLSHHIESGKNLPDALDKTVDAVRLAVEKTKEMTAKTGRSRWLGDRAAGTPDPGAVVLLWMLEAFSEGIHNLDDAVA